jgi:hypothetical protein
MFYTIGSLGNNLQVFILARAELRVLFHDHKLQPNTRKEELKKTRAEEH